MAAGFLQPLPVLLRLRPDVRMQHGQRDRKVTAGLPHKALVPVGLLPPQAVMHVRRLDPRQLQRDTQRQQNMQQRHGIGPARQGDQHGIPRSQQPFPPDSCQRFLCKAVRPAIVCHAASSLSRGFTKAIGCRIIAAADDREFPSECFPFLRPGAKCAPPFWRARDFRGERDGNVCPTAGENPVFAPRRKMRAALLAGKGFSGGTGWQRLSHGRGKSRFCAPAQNARHPFGGQGIFGGNGMAKPSRSPIRCGASPGW